jgi:hypothetical protein
MVNANAQTPEATRLRFDPSHPSARKATGVEGPRRIKESTSTAEVHMSAEIQNCGWVFKVQCPQQWEQLAATADPTIRICGVCLQHVYHCDTPSEVTAHAKLGHCIALVQVQDDDDSTTWLGEVEEV